MNILKDIVTGIDGQSYALVKVVGLLTVAVFIGLELAAFILSKPFDGQSYGIGAGAAIAAMGAAMKFSEHSEPAAKS